jgi:hypothetical protein
MAEEQIKPNEPARAFEWAPSPNDNPDIYANYTHVSWTLVDVRIQFGRLVPERTGLSKFVSEERGSVTLAWQQAKILAKSLDALIASYEAVNGEIKPLQIAPVPKGD